jgi:hypothetical protein
MQGCFSVLLWFFCYSYMRWRVIAFFIYIKYYLNKKVVNVYLTHSNKWTSPVLLGWRGRCLNRSDFYFFGWRLMRLTVLITVVRCVRSKDHWLRSGHTFYLPSLFPLSPPKKTCWSLQKNKEIWIFYLFVESN